MMSNKAYPLIALLATITVSCSIHEVDQKDESAKFFYAQIEAPSSSEQTRVYADDDLSVLWHADDRVSIFDKNTYNQEYRFTGKTGANAGAFEKVANSGFVTGNALSSVYSVYPYKESTEISNQGVISVDLPATQLYTQNSFGLDANTMVSVSSDNLLMFKNVGGYLRLSLYGEGVSVSSITLKGNNGEKIAGYATISMPLNGVPSVEMTKDASDEITLVCDTPVPLGKTTEESKDFWFVVPPVDFSQGFSVSVSCSGEVYEKVTTKSITITRNNLSKMSPVEVEVSQPNNVIYYTSTNGKIVSPFQFEYPGDRAVFGAQIISNVYVNGVGIMTFDGDVKTIGANAFYGRTSLSSIIIPESVTSIGESAFNGCSSLTSIRIPQHVSDISELSFAGCSSMQRFDGKYASTDGLFLIYNRTIIAVALASVGERVTIPEGVTRIGEVAFSSCPNLTSLIIPEGVISIGYGAFYNCLNLSNITLPNTLKSIGGHAFSFCRSITSITIPEDVTSIAEELFSECSSLSSITIPDGVTSIGFAAFSGCTSLTSITIPSSVRSIGNLAFTNCSSLQRISGKYASADGLFLVYSGSIIAIASASLEGCVTIPDGVTSIEMQAFYGCSDITSIIISDSVTSIGESAFADCIDLTSITIPKSVVNIGRYAFSGCHSLASVIIPDSVSDIAEKTFYECSSLKHVIIPDSVTSIGMQAFYGCSSLTEITIPGSVTSVGYFAFAFCSNLTSVIISEGVKDIMGASFSYCSNLTNITIPNSVTNIGSQTFEQCTSLTNVTIPESVTSIGGRLFFKCTSLASVTIPESVTSIGSYAFSYCSSLTSITLPNSVVSIGKSAFDCCTSLSSITIPESVTSIGNYGFYGCSSLTSIIVLPNTPPQGGIEMLYNTNDAPIYVPSVSVADYKLAQYWSDYSSRIQAITE